MTTVLEPPVLSEPEPLEPELPDTDLVPAEETGDIKVPVGRASLGVLLSSLAAAVMVGGVFLGPGARVIAGLSAVLGVGVALGARRLRGAVTANIALLVGVALVGLLMMVPAGSSSVFHVGQLVREAAHQGSVLRPPVNFTPGWHAIVGWLLATVGMVSAWTAIVLQRPTIGLLLPLPVTVVSGISVPSYAQVPSGIVVVVLMAAALGVIATGQLVGEQDERLSLGFQLRRAGRSVVVIAVLSAVLVGASRANFLFPKPAFNPASAAQLPHTVPPSNAPDRVLFTVDSPSLGPYRVGDLDVYDGSAWRFAPVADSSLRDVPASGVVTSGIPTGVTATITIRGYTGSTVLPSLYRLLGIVAVGPRFAYDNRSDTIRVAQGQISPGLRYEIASAALPTVPELEADVLPVPPEARPFLSAPPVPPAVKALIDQNRKANAWDTFVALRQLVLSTVVASGPGVPIPVPPARVADLLATHHEGSPYEATAAIALMSRWAGIPSRIGFGFQADPATKTPKGFPIRPRDAISYPEVYFPQFGWLPVTGLPQKAKANDKNTNANKNSDVKPSEGFGVQLAIPQETPPPNPFAQRLLFTLLGLLLLALLGYLGYLAAPGVQKVLARSRRRNAARALGPRARIALAYAEFRDAATDLGYGHESDTPLAFLARFGEDEEHRELAWLVTRSLWGDLRDQVTPAMAGYAEELARALRLRLSSAHPGTMRVIAAFSRLSLRSPYAPELLTWLAEDRKKETARGFVAAPVPG